MANARGDAIDKTYLSLETATERGFIHRDYIAHCLRWSHVVKRLCEKGNYKDAVILDVGCGRELPLPTMLYSSRLIPLRYVGVDVGPVNDSSMEKFHTGKMDIKVYERTDILQIERSDIGIGLAHGWANFVTCFEMLEHIEPAHLMKVLDHLKTLMSPEGVAWFSTPVWNVVDCAANHVNEMKFGALAAIFEASGWTIDAVHGTFASMRDYQALVEKNPALSGVFTSLRAYYDVNFLSCIFAPLFPEQSRNCLWEVRPLAKPLPLVQRKYPSILKVPTPWGSSEKWRDMDRENAVEMP